MRNKGRVSVGTRLLVSIIIIVALAITTINLLTLYGWLESPTPLTYAVIVGIYFLPFLIIAATVNKLFIGEKDIFKSLKDKTNELVKKEKLDFNFERKESIKVVESVHPVLYVKTAIASTFSVTLGGFYFILLRHAPLTAGIDTVLPTLLPVLIVCSIIHFFSKNVFTPGGWGEFLEHAWIALLVTAISISFMISIRKHILQTYPRAFWESFLGLPFSLPALLFMVIMLLIGGILIRLSDIYKLEGGPFKASGSTVVLLSISFLVPQFAFINWSMLLMLVSQAFSIALIIYGIATAFILYQIAGVEYIVTDRRVIKFHNSAPKKSIFYSISKIRKISMAQDFLASKFNYGNIILHLKSKSRLNKPNAFCVLFAVETPGKIVKAIKSLKSYKKPKPKKKIRSIVKPKKKKRKNKKPFYYRLIIPFIIFLFIGTFFSLSVEAVNQENRHIEESYIFDYQTFSKININATYEIYCYDIEDEILDSDEIRELYDVNPDKVEDSLLGEVEKLIESLLNQTFEPAREGIDTNTTVFIEHPSLDIDADGPIILGSNSTISISPVYFGLPEQSDIDKLGYEIFKAGAVYTREITLSCKEGHRAEYVFQAQDNIEFDNHVFTLDNLNNSQNEKLVELKQYHQEPVEIRYEEPELNLLVDIHTIERREDEEFALLDLNLTSSMISARTPQVISNELPTGFQLDHITSDLIRAFYDTGTSQIIDEFLISIEDEFKVNVGEMGEIKYVSSIDIQNVSKEEGPIELYQNASLKRTLSNEEKYSTAVMSLPNRYSVSESVQIRLYNHLDWGFDYLIKVPEDVNLISARAGSDGLTIYEDEKGRDFIEYRLESKEDVELGLEIGTTIYFVDFLPFLIVISILFFIWLGLNMVRPKKKRGLRRI